MSDKNDDRLDNIMTTMENYSEDLLAMAKNMSKDAKNNDNEHIGKVSNIIKMLVGTMENPYALDGFHFHCRIFASDQILAKISDGGKSDIRDRLIEYYEKLEELDSDKNDV